MLNRYIIFLVIVFIMIFYGCGDDVTYPRIKDGFYDFVLTSQVDSLECEVQTYAEIIREEVSGGDDILTVIVHQTDTLLAPVTLTSLSQRFTSYKDNGGGDVAEMFTFSNDSLSSEMLLNGDTITALDIVLSSDLNYKVYDKILDFSYYPKGSNLTSDIYLRSCEVPQLSLWW